MKAIILAAGFGTRLYPLTQNTAKALLKLGDKTILDHLVEKLERLTAVDEIIVVANGRFYADFAEWQKRSSYKKPIRIIENKIFAPVKRLGAVGDLNLALKACCGRDDDFLVLCGDNYFDSPVSYFLLPCLGHKRNVFVGVYDAKDPLVASECGVVLTDDHNRITDFEEKPEHPKSTKIAIGIYYFPGSYRCRVQEYLEVDKMNPDRIGDFIAWIAAKEPIYAVDFYGSWVDVGSLKAYNEVQDLIQLGAIR